MPHLGAAEILDRLASDAAALADDLRTPARTVAEVERRAEEGERIAAEVRAIFRGRAFR